MEQPRRYGKTQIFLINLAKELRENKSVFLVTQEYPTNYIERLFEDYNIIVEVIPHYVTPSLTNKFHKDGNKITEYLSTISGYEFKKI